MHHVEHHQSTEAAVVRKLSNIQTKLSCAVSVRVFLILILIGISGNAGIDLVECVCAPIRYHTTFFISGKKRYLATSQLAKLALTDVTYLKSIFLCCSKTALTTVLPLVTTIFKSNKEEQRADRVSKISALSNILHWKVKRDV